MAYQKRPNGGAPLCIGCLSRVDNGVAVCESCMVKLQQPAPPAQPDAAALLCDFLDWLLDDEGNERDWFFKRYGLSIGERSNIRIAKRFLATRAAAGGQDASV